MKYLKVTLLLVAYALTFIISTCFISLAIADDLAYRGAIDEEYIELYECAMEEDNNCRIKTIDYHNIKNGEVTYLCVYNDDETSSFFVILELKKTAPFRYEWVVRE